jgi:hypothetical protein
MEFPAYRWLIWASFLVPAVLVSFFSALLLPVGLLVAVPLLGLLAVWIYWVLGRQQRQIDWHDGRIPMPGVFGLLGVDLTDPS